MAIVGIATQDIEQALRLRPAHFKVYMAIIRFVNIAGRAWPSIDTIAATAAVSRRTVIYAIHELEEEGFLNVQHRRGRGLSNIYQVVARWVRQKVQPLRREGRGGLRSLPPFTLQYQERKAAFPSTSRLLHLFSWEDLGTKEKFLSALCCHYEENIGPLSQSMEETLETRLVLNHPPPPEVAEAVIAEAVSYNVLNFGYVLQILDSTIKRGWIRDPRRGGYLRFRKSEWKVYRTQAELRAATAAA